MLNEFRTFNADRCDIHELVALAAFGSTLRTEYEKHNIEEPDWVDGQLKSLHREIRVRNADRLEAERRQVQNKLDGLKTPDQKRRELQKRKAEIDEELARV